MESSKTCSFFVKQFNLGCFMKVHEGEGSEFCQKCCVYEGHGHCKTLLCESEVSPQCSSTSLCLQHCQEKTHDHCSQLRWYM